MQVNDFFKNDFTLLKYNYSLLIIYWGGDGIIVDIILGPILDF